MIEPHGGLLISRFAPVLHKSKEKIEISQAGEIDIYNLATGAYSPLVGFVKKADFESITQDMKISDGTLWSIPIIFDITSEQALEIESNNSETLEFIDNTGLHIASLIDIEVYPFAKQKYCQSVFGTTDNEHPGVERIMKK